MAKFKKRKKEQPAVSTASLPDIVFMLLFFFMVTTVMKEAATMVVVEKPGATELEDVKNKALVDYIYVGTPLEKNVYGDRPVIQLDGQIVKGAFRIRGWKENKLGEREDSEKPWVTTSLKVDKSVKMQIVADIKHELREMNDPNALRINYSVTDVGTMDFE